MQDASLQRSKATVGITLSKKTVDWLEVSFDNGSSHKAVYDALVGAPCKGLMPLRRACCSAKLIPSERRQQAIEVAIEVGNSPKISALLKTIEDKMTKNEKGVIFSNFTSFLDLIQVALEERKVHLCEIRW
uniref:Uncharacterized protein n=1 Tax=Pseudo-nitzschia australis TaxID=44445 RepID=A0A7S4A9H0_9STRA